MGDIFRTAMLALGLALPIATGTPSLLQASELMTACSADIASLCKDVKEGRGRISACLYARENKVSSACKPALAKITTDSMFERMIPDSIRNLNDTPYEAELRKSCATDIKAHCSGVSPGEDRLLACLYASNEKVSKSCRDEAKTVLEKIR